MDGNLAASDRQTYMTEEEMGKLGDKVSDQEINIRAVKVLGCEYYHCEKYPSCCKVKINKAVINLVNDQLTWKKEIGAWFRADLLKFTTSRDWAWLLVDECNKRGLLKKLYQAILYDQLNTGEMHLCLTASPEQITLAALEVLENE